MAEDYYLISPYNYCDNNPINRIDPNGMNYYLLQNDGNLHLLLVCEENKVFSWNGEEMYSTTIKDGDFLEQLYKSPLTEYDGHYGETSNIEDAFNLFKFVADHTNVEWAISGYKNAAQSTYLVRTSHDEARVRETHGNNEVLNLIFSMHIHKYLIDPSGYIDRWNSASLDMAVLADVYNKFGKAGKTQRAEFPRYYIYHQASKALYYYNEKIRGIYIRSIKKGSDFYRNMGF
jgi:hypothetical protein